MVHRSTLKTAQSLLDRFFRDAEGRTNHQLDVGFLLSDLGLSRERSDPAMDFLVSRGLINSFGPEVAYLTDSGVAACVDEIDIEKLGPARSFGEGSEPPPSTAPPAPEADLVLPPEDVPHLIHVNLDGHTSMVVLAAHCSVGRSEDCDVFIDDKRASKRHAVVRYERNAYVLEDLTSANGTLLNGAYCVEPTRLQNDDEIVIGRTMLVFQAPESFPAPAGAEDPVLPPTVEPSGAATETPSVAPELAEPGFRVVRGRPDEGLEVAPATLFEDRPTQAADLFDGGEASGGEASGGEASGGLPSFEAPAELSDLSAEDEEEATPAATTSGALPVAPSVAAETSSPAVEVFDEEPTRVPAFSGDLVDELDQTVLRAAPPPEALLGEGGTDSVLELEEVVGEASSPFSTPADVRETLTMDVGENLPDATPSLADIPMPPDLRQELRANKDVPRLLAELGELRDKVREIAGAAHPVVDAIEVLLTDPIVRAFAEAPERNH